jgi:two-component system OmpR family sensor kinase
VKRPLFWKLLLSSWLTLILIALGNAWIFKLAARAFSPWVQSALQGYQGQQLGIAAALLASLGPQALDVFIHNLPPGDQLEALTGPVPAPVKIPPYVRRASRVVHTVTGDVTLVYTSSAYQLFPRRPADLSRLPLELLLVDFVAITVFTVFFARYLAKPFQVLRTGLEHVAAGDLSVRVYKQLASRRDEMADLAQNFDLMAERTQQLLHARERLLHDVSHELRSPLTRLRLAVDLARQNPTRSLESLDRIEHETQRLSDLVDELLNLSRAEFNAARSEAYFAVTELLAAVVEDARFEAQAKGVEVKVEIPARFKDAAGPVINGSPELLRKGFDNVLRNAVKVSRASQTIDVRVDSPEPPSNRLRITVSDNGPGVPVDALERIFDPFVRLESQLPVSGYGLGLAIARSAALAHRGSVTAINRPAGGLSIVFDLPVQQMEWLEPG